MPEWAWWVLAVWLPAAAVGASVLGRVIRDADRSERSGRPPHEGHGAPH